jgi:hypothetical protein
MDGIQRIAQARQEREKNELTKQQLDTQANTSLHMQKVIFEAFQSMVDAIQGDKTKADAISQIFKVLEQLDEKTNVSKVEMESLKSGLATLEKELKAIPTGDLKQIPKFLQQRESIKIENIEEFTKAVEEVTKAVKAQKITVQAPKVEVKPPMVNVPAPVVNVAEPNLTPLTKGMEEVGKAIKSQKFPDVVKTETTNTLITEKFDEYKIKYDGLDEDDEDQKIEAIIYYLKGKQVARINYKYDSNGNLMGGKKA